MALPEGAVEWVEQRCGGRVVDIEQQVRWRPHHFLTVERSDDTLRVLARSERQAVAGGSKFQQHFDLAHEARVLEALQGHGLKVPKFYGFNDEHRFILMEQRRRHQRTQGCTRRRNPRTGDGRVHRTTRQPAPTRPRVHDALGPEDPRESGGDRVRRQVRIPRGRLGRVETTFAPGAVAGARAVVAARQRPAG